MGLNPKTWNLQTGIPTGKWHSRVFWITFGLLCVGWIMSVVGCAVMVGSKDREGVPYLSLEFFRTRGLFLRTEVTVGLNNTAALSLSYDRGYISTRW